MPCNTQVCGAVCCTFITVHWPIRSDEIRNYFQLHNVEVKNADDDGLWLKFPVPCQAFNPKTKQCTTYNTRPEACSRYPQTESPFIPKKLCSMQR